MKRKIKKERIKKPILASPRVLKRKQGIEPYEGRFELRKMCSFFTKIIKEIFLFVLLLVIYVFFIFLLYGFFQYFFGDSFCDFNNSYQGKIYQNGMLIPEYEYGFYSYDENEKKFPFDRFSPRRRPSPPTSDQNWALVAVFSVVVVFVCCFYVFEISRTPPSPPFTQEELVRCLRSFGRLVYVR